MKKRHLYIYIDFREDVGTPFYVGKGYENRTRDFRRRNKVWHRIVAKHGIRREVIMSSYDNEFVCQEEMRLISELKTRVEFDGANMTDGGEGSVGWHPSDETRLKISQSLTGKMAGKKHPLFGRGHTQTAKQKMSKTRKGMSQPWKQKGVEQLDTMGRRIAVYPSMRAAAVATATSVTGISACCRGRYQQSNGFGWRYVADTGRD
jgi:hypothetical protein